MQSWGLVEIAYFQEFSLSTSDQKLPRTEKKNVCRTLSDRLLISFLLFSENVQPS